MPRSQPLEVVVDAAWGDFLGCEPALLHEPGAHLVPGGDELRGRERVFAFRVGVATLVCCPDRLRERAVRVLAEVDPVIAFSAAVCARIADVAESEVHGPAAHAFVDSTRFASRAPREGRRVSRDDPLLAALRSACGDDDWGEAGFLQDVTLFDEVLYGLEHDGQLVAAGNMTPYRGLPADVGLVTRPDARGRGLARRLAAKMVADALPKVGIVRYRALLANTASLRVAESLGFVPRGQNLVVRLS